MKKYTENSFYVVLVTHVINPLFKAFSASPMSSLMMFPYAPPDREVTLHFERLRSILIILVVVTALAA